MSSQRISATLRQLVREHAADRCEYCLVRDEDVLLPHQPDHIIAEQRGGEAADGAYILPQTAIGRVTVRLLELYHPDRVRVRQALIRAGTYP